ncbi:MAG: O-antigen ligase family protein [Streptosporangiaceae bacterium]
MTRVRLLPRTAYRLWPIVLPLALMLASDYKLRSRSDDQAIGGKPDLMILAEIGVYAAAALFLYLRFGMRPPTRRRTGLLLLAWCWTGYAAMSALWSPFPTLGVVRGAQLLITMAVVHVLATRATTTELRRMAHAFVAVVVGSVVIGAVHPFPRTHLTLDRFNWLYVHPVIAGVYLGLAVLLVVGFLVRHGVIGWSGRDGKSWSPAVYLLALAVLSGALVATGTRGAALGCAAGLLVLMATANGPRGRADLVVLGFSVAALAVFAFSDQILAFIQRGESAEKLSSLNSRTDLWSLALDAFRQQPIFGHGMGAARGLFLAETGLGGGHNAFVNALVDEGVVGTALFLGLLLTLTVVLCSLLRSQRTRADAGTLLAMMAFFVTDGITTEGLATSANVSGIWLLLVVAWTETLRRRNPPPPLPGTLVPQTAGASWKP